MRGVLLWSAVGAALGFLPALHDSVVLAHVLDDLSYQTRCVLFTHWLQDATGRTVLGALAGAAPAAWYERRGSNPRIPSE